MRTAFALPFLLAAVAVGACQKKSEPPADTGTTAAPPAAPAVVRVATIQLGKQIGSDKRVAAPMTSFGKRDTIYASVATEGTAASATLTAKWMFEDGQVVSETSETIAPTGPAVTEFHIAKPSGWPAGKYTVQVSLDGTPAGTQSFDVK